VDFAQFVHIMQKKMKDCDPIAEMTAAFKVCETACFVSVGQISDCFVNRFTFYTSPCLWARGDCSDVSVLGFGS